MANSLLSDLLPRLGHSHPLVRKKTIVTLYRLALVYPETLRPAWPKIKERLLDDNEDPSVTAAVVNVVCELGWRRPQDFLPLAPRLFDLLVEGGNNWMAIKIIKLVHVISIVSSMSEADIELVRNIDPIGASSGEEVATPTHDYNEDYASNVTFVRMHQWNNTRWNTTERSGHN